jgi:RNA polymerase sigma-70 factor (ECF subfamily)
MDMSIIGQLGAAGTADDWTAIYNEHARFIHQMMISKVHNLADAEELTAEVFSRALTPLRVTASEREIRAYLLVTARTVLAAHWHRVLSWPTTVLRDDLAEPSFAASPASDERRVQAVLAALPARYRQILELRFLQGCTLKEAADKMEITVGNAKVLQHRALARAARASKETMMLAGDAATT